MTDVAERQNQDVQVPGRGTAPPKSLRRSLEAIAVFAAILASILVFRPDRNAPFDVLDFSEFLPLLQRSESPAEQLRGLVAYYAQHGRASLVPFVALVAKWNVWGTDVAAWQWFRAATMWLLIWLAYLLIRRLGAGRVGAMAGASVLLFSPPAVDGWTRLTMAEPSATVLVLLISLVALTKRPGWAEWRVGTVCAVLSALLVLTKEMLVVALAFPLLLAVVHEIDSGPLWRSRRLRTVVAAVAASVFVTAVPVVLVAAGARSDGYSSEFGAQIRPFGDAIAAWLRGLTPFEPFTSLPGPAQGLLDVAFLALLIVGWRTWVAGGTLSRNANRLLLIGLLAFPLVGGAIYLPWPVFARFYAIPFLLSLAILVGLAVSAVDRWEPKLRLPAVLVWLACLVTGAVPASTEATRSASARTLHARAIAMVASAPTVDSFFVASPRLPRLDWVGLGATLARYGVAQGQDVPVARDITCQDAQEMLDALPPRSLLLTYSGVCNYTRAPDSMIVERFRTWRFSARPSGHDSIFVAVFGPDVR